jgi:hypothetical protein
MDSSYQSELRSLFARNSDVQMSSAAIAAVISLPFMFVFGLVVAPEGSALLWFDDLMLFGAACFGAFATLLARFRYRGSKTGRAWGLIFFGMTCMAFGEGAWGFQELILGQEVTSPSVADIGYLAFYVPIFFGLLAMPQAPVTGLSRLRLGLDITITVGAISLISGYLLISALIRDSEFAAPDLIGIAYPVLDLTIVFAAIVLAVRSGFNLTSASIGLLALGFAFIAGTDSVFTYLNSVGEYDSGNYLDTGWVIGYALIACAGFLAAGRQVNLDSFRDAEARQTSFWQTGLLYSALVPVVVMLFARSDGTALQVNLFVMIGFIGLGSVVMLRHVINHFEHAQLYQQLEQLTIALQDKIRVEKMRSILQSDDRFDIRDQREST